MTDNEHFSAPEPAGVRLAHEIRRRRTQAGLSQPQLARKIGYTRQYVSLAERPDHNLPSAELVRALDDALGSGGALTTMREQGKREQESVRRKSAVSQAKWQHPPFATTTHEPAAEITTDFRAIESLDRLKLDVPLRRRAGQAEVEQVKLMSGALASSENLYGGGMAVEAGIAHLRWACRTLEAQSHPAVTSSLFEAVGNLAGVVAFSAFDIGDHTSASRCFRIALSCAEQGGSWELRAATLTDMARQAIYLRDLDEALSLIEFAQVRADRLTTTARAVTAVVRARVLAMLGRHDEARAEIDRADAYFAEHRAATAPPWLVYYDDAEHAGSSARALIPVAVARKQPAEAAERLTTAIRLHSDAYPRSRAFSTTRLATLHMAAGDPHEAVALGQQAVAGAARFHSRRMNEELRVLMHTARRHLSITGVADLSHSLALATGDA
ncbi:helix-turn-helix transcriptional regulator [Saccharothrix sp. Mg75]|uniref:helix-turn-helix transcriptional regulator n=1 Tax=Saccharothrix sp. Mg75 TaxID=3445357 RepID=UPI003EEA52CD